MDENQSRGVDTPTKEAAGITQGFQVWYCKVKWFTISETSFTGFFFPIACHLCGSSCCLSKGISVSDKTPSKSSSSAQTNPIQFLDYATHIKKFSWFCSALDQSKGSYCESTSYKLWIFIISSQSGILLCSCGGFSCSSLSCANESQCACYMQASAFCYDLNSGLLTQSGIGNTWLQYVGLFYSWNGRILVAASRDFQSKFQPAFKRNWGKRANSPAANLAVQKFVILLNHLQSILWM